MRKIIAAINMTLDGFCDHTGLLPDEEIHEHYKELLEEGDLIIYGRKTYQLMQYWQTLAENPSGEKSMDDFAMAIDNIPKIVFTKTLTQTNWKSATIAIEILEELISSLKQQTGKDIFIGSRSLIIQLMNLNLIDEYQLCIHPVVAGNGLPLFENLYERTSLKLTKTKTFKKGAIILYYQPKNKQKTIF
jgi:dihydrofolate reductase